MNKEEKKLLNIKLYLEYYKKDITDRYNRLISNIVLDNDLLNVLDDRVYITAFDKYTKLQQENQSLKERLKIIDNYLDKNYTVENQYWFDHIQDIVKDR